jgi:hypothetical protein
MQWFLDTNVQDRDLNGRIVTSLMEILSFAAGCYCAYELISCFRSKVQNLSTKQKERFRSTEWSLPFSMISSAAQSWRFSADESKQEINIVQLIHELGHNLISQVVESQWRDQGIGRDLPFRCIRYVGIVNEKADASILQKDAGFTGIRAARKSSPDTKCKTPGPS